jgi:CHAT domain-containing protein
VPRLDLAELTVALGDRALVELVALDGRLHALVMVRGRVAHRVLGPVDETLRELAALRFGVRRLVLRYGSAASRRAAADGVRHACGRLDGLLLAPVADLIGDRPLVLAPTGDLHALPWPMLDHCRDRSLSVVPSSALWWQASTRPRPGGAVVLVAGPAPEHAADEVAAVGARLGGAVVLSGTRAKVTTVLSTLDGAGTAHIASHGSFRADNPLFSYVQLVDGPMTVYDLSALSRPPGLIVLSACDSGLSAVHPGDELQGLSAALLGLGATAVVASLGPVDDEATRRLMVDFHDRLPAGDGPASALAAAQAALPREDSATGGSFVCLGAG